MRCKVEAAYTMNGRRVELYLVHKGGSKKELKNYRPVAIINVIVQVVYDDGKRDNK